MVGDKINLRELFTKSESELPSWVIQDNIIYLIRNLKNGKGYVGQAKWFPSRFIYPGIKSHFTTYVNCCIDGPKYYTILYRALRKYKSRNFEVSVLEELEGPEFLDEKEEYWIKELHTHISDWGYNMTWGGKDLTHLRKIIIKKYPGTNGVSPQCIAAAHKRLKELYPDTNGVPPQATEAAHKRLKELYPETNGMPPQAFESSMKRRLEIYPETNGMPIECLEAARKVLLEKYPDTNGVPPQNTKAWNEAGRAKLKELWPETNGSCPENSQKWHNAGVKRRKELYPDTNGVPYEWVAAGRAKMKELYPELNGMCPQCIEAGAEKLRQMYPETNGLPPQCTEASHEPDVERARIFTRISNLFIKLEKQGLDINFYNLYFHCGCGLWENIVKNFFTYQQDSRWDHRLDCFLDEMYWDTERQKLELKPEVRYKYTKD